MGCELTCRLLWILLAVMQLGATARGQQLTVATKDSAPFAYRDPAGEWVGISVDLWDEIAERLGLEFGFVATETPAEMIRGVVAGRFDVAVAAISLSAERELVVDFSHPYFSTGLGVAVRDEAGTGIERILRGLVSWQFLTLLGSVILALVGAGYLFWLAEHRRNPQFEGYRKGVSQGLWWSTIMLFGHKGIYPASAAGKVLAASAMIVSILLLSVLTGAIASALTVGHFESVIRDHQDLRHVRTTAVDGTIGADFLRRERIAFQSAPSVQAALVLLAEGRCDAVVHDAPLLEFEVGADGSGGLRVLPETFELQDYGLVVAQGSPLRERINAALLEVRASARWEEIQFRHLGR